jgi:5-(carboxyamino)imidazole ribonucleotide synthase
MFDIGFLGGGQLARMSIQAAQRMGLTCLSLDPGEVTPASQVAASIRGSLDDPEAIANVLRQCERVTLENEFIPARALEHAVEVSGRNESCLLPGISALATIQDKLLQRRALLSAGVPSPNAISMEEDFQSLGFPMVLKARFGGYDGKGTRYARTPEELEGHRSDWEGGGWLAEDFVAFRRELAVMVFISRSGEVGTFPTMETVQQNHVCDLVYPCDTDASEIAIAAVRAVGGVGLFGVELFQTEDGGLFVNEIAPRPHNTGHYSLDWGATSQFEQHVRLVADLPLGEVHGGEVCMVNLLGQPGAGDFRPALAACLSDPSVSCHWYGKAESRPGRKMGHLNVRATSKMDLTLLKRARDAQHRFYKAWTKPV